MSGKQEFQIKEEMTSDDNIPQGYEGGAYIKTEIKEGITDTIIKDEKFDDITDIIKEENVEEYYEAINYFDENADVEQKCGLAVPTDATCEYEHDAKRIKSEPGDEDHEVLSCQDCKFIATKARSIQLHEVVHTTEKPYLCIECGFQSSYTSNFNRHILNHSKDSPFTCPYCNICFNQKNLLNHIRSVHPDSFLKCEKCGFTVSQPSKMANHKRRCNSKEMKNKLLQCRQCVFVATKQISIEQHNIVHIEQGPYRCTQCEYNTREKRTFSGHILKHNKDKPYSCAFCSYCAIQSSHLKNHINSEHAD